MGTPLLHNSDISVNSVLGWAVLVIMLWNYVAENYFRSVKKAQQNLQQYLLKVFSHVEKSKSPFSEKVSFLCSRYASVFMNK